MALMRARARRFGDAPDGLVQLVQGGREVGEALVDDPRIALVSATGSTAMGRAVGPRVAQRFGRVLLELGGNNAMIVCPYRRPRACRAGDPVLRGGDGRPALHDASPADRPRKHRRPAWSRGCEQLVREREGRRSARSGYAGRSADRRGRFHGDGRRARRRIERVDAGPGGFYVRPAIVEAEAQQGKRPQGDVRAHPLRPALSAISTRRWRSTMMFRRACRHRSSRTILREAERFLSAAGSDCGIANVNIGPSGAEIGGAFGGEKETGGGRESGSDSWRAYMRRQTNTVNYGTDLPLAQGIRFDVAP